VIPEEEGGEKDSTEEENKGGGLATVDASATKHVLNVSHQSLIGLFRRTARPYYIALKATTT
jgi:hypothetical protein